MSENPAPKEIDLNGVRYIISDWDGTIVDSMPAYTKAFSLLLRNEFNISEEKSSNFFQVESGGLPLSYQIKECARRYAGKQIDNTLDLEDRFWQGLEDLEPEMIEGAKEMIEETKKRGYKFVVWSGTKTEVLIRIAKKLGIDSYIDFIIGNNPGSTSMTKGKGLFEVISAHFGLPQNELATQTLVIGDMIGDIEAGREIGAITCGFGDPKDPKFKNADFVVQTHKELLDMLIPVVLL